MAGEPCSECGALVGGNDACQRLFDDLGLRAFQDSPYAAMRRLAVAIEHGGDQQVNDRVQSWLSRTRHIEKPVVPSVRGKVTIADVTGAALTDLPSGDSVFG